MFWLVCVCVCEGGEGKDVEKKKDDENGKRGTIN